VRLGGFGQREDLGPDLVAGFAVLLVAGNLLAAVPGAVAARTLPAVVLRAE